MAVRLGMVRCAPDIARPLAGAVRAKFLIGLRLRTPCRLSKRRCRERSIPAMMMPFCVVTALIRFWLATTSRGTVPPSTQINSCPKTLAARPRARPDASKSMHRDCNHKLSLLNFTVLLSDIAGSFPPSLVSYACQRIQLCYKR